MELEEVLQELKDPSPFIRQRAAWRLGEMRDQRAVPALIAALDDEDEGVGENAATALGLIGDKTAVPALFDKLNRVGNQLIATYIIRALVRMGDAEILDGLLEHSSIFFQPILGLVERTVSEKALRMLSTQMILNPHHPVTRDASRILEQADFEFAREALLAWKAGASDAKAWLPLLKWPIEVIQSKAAWHLGIARDPVAVPYLVELLNNATADYLQHNCIEALRNIGTPEALAAVEAWQHSNEAR